MIKVQSWVGFACALAALVGSCLWYYAQPDFEPAIAIIVSIGGIAASYWPRFGKKSRLTAEKKIEARDKWRPIFEKFFREMAQQDAGTDAIIHDVDRVDIYPKNDGKKGISSWFRVGLMGTYHRGILLGLRWLYITQQPNGTWQETTKEDGAQKVILLGELPYDAIESVNFDGDPYYNKPHLFCHFEFKREPYERLYYGDPFKLMDSHQTYYKEVAEYMKKPWWKIWGR